MGTNHRYPHVAGERAEQRELTAARAKGPLQSLSSEQLALRHATLTRAPPDRISWGLAWVRFGDRDIQCTVRIGCWTQNAVGIELHIGEERLRCWVWQGAVTRLENRRDAWA